MDDKVLSHPEYVTLRERFYAARALSPTSRCTLTFEELLETCSDPNLTPSQRVARAKISATSFNALRRTYVDPILGKHDRLEAARNRRITRLTNDFFALPCMQKILDSGIKEAGHIVEPNITQYITGKKSLRRTEIIVSGNLCRIYPVTAEHVARPDQPERYGYTQIRDSGIAGYRFIIFPVMIEGTELDTLVIPHQVLRDDLLQGEGVTRFCSLFRRFNEPHHRQPRVVTTRFNKAWHLIPTIMGAPST